MSLSEREQRVLNQLEQDLRIPTRPPSAPRWSPTRRPKPTAAGALAVTAGAVLVLVGLALDNAVGVALAVAGYVVAVGGVQRLVTGLSRARVAGARRPRPRTAPRPSRYHP